MTVTTLTRLIQAKGVNMKLVFLCILFLTGCQTAHKPNTVNVKNEQTIKCEESQLSTLDTLKWIDDAISTVKNATELFESPLFRDIVYKTKEAINHE